MIQAVERYRPTATNDDEGGYTRTLGTATTVYGALEPNDAEIVFVFTAGQDVAVEDIIKISDGQSYTVEAIVTPSGGHSSRASLERIARPIDG